MTEPELSIGDLFLSRLEFGRKISALQAEKMARQREGVGADILLRDQQLSGPDGGTAEERATWADASRRAAEVHAAVAALDAELDALEAEMAEIDRQIADRQRDA